MSTSLSKILFFILIAVLYIVFFISSNHFYNGTTSDIKRGLILLSSAVIFSLVFVGYAQVTKLFPEGYCDGGIGAKACRGGSYLYNGDSPRAKFCQALASTPEGQAEIDSYECGSGFSGLPGKGFQFTPESNSMYNNERCNRSEMGSMRDNGIF